MIIKFDQSPEEYFRLSRLALERKEPDRAMIYGEKALRGKGTTEYKLSLAEIFLMMGRYSDAADLALDALCYGRGMRGEIYDILARSAGEMGLFYESLHYIAQKAHYEEDDDALDAMDEVMQEIMSKEPEEENLFLVGKQKKTDDSLMMMQASLAYNHGEYQEAFRCASEVEQSSPHHASAQALTLRALIKMKEDEQAIRAAEEIVAEDPQNAYAVYLLVDKFKKKEYLPLLREVKGSKEELYFAIAAAERLEEHKVAKAIAERLLAENPYDKEGYFIAAAVALNGGDRTESEDLLKRLFALYTSYPAPLILKGWRRLKNCRVPYQGKMPGEVLQTLRRHVRKGNKSAEDFVCSMLTDESYRASLLLLLEEGDRMVAGEVLDRLGEASNKQVDGFFAKLLIRSGVDLLIKRAVLAELLFRKHKGRLPITQFLTPCGVSCAKPLHYELYPEELREAYINVYSFVTCMTDGAGEERVRDLAEKALVLGLGDKERAETIGGAFICRLLSEDLVPAGAGMRSTEDSCRFIMTYVFGVSRFSFVKAKRLAALLGD